MRRNIINVMLGFFVVVMFGLAGCGSGGGGASATLTPVGTTVDPTPFKSVFLGSTAGATFNVPTIVGSDSQGNTWTGSFSVAADGATVFEAQNVNKRRSSITLQKGSNTPVNVVTTSYFQVADDSAYKSITSTGVTTVPISQTALPSAPKVGDFGSIGTFSASDGTTTTSTWALNPDFNGASILVISAVTKNGTTVIATEADSYYLDASGVPTKISISLTTGGTTVTLAGSKTNSNQ